MFHSREAKIILNISPKPICLAYGHNALIKRTSNDYKVNLQILIYFYTLHRICCFYYLYNLHNINITIFYFYYCFTKLSKFSETWGKLHSRAHRHLGERLRQWEAAWNAEEVMVDKGIINIHKNKVYLVILGLCEYSEEISHISFIYSTITSAANGIY